MLLMSLVPQSQLTMKTPRSLVQAWLFLYSVWTVLAPGSATVCRAHHQPLNGLGLASSLSPKKKKKQKFRNAFS